MADDTHPHRPDAARSALCQNGRAIIVGDLGDGVAVVEELAFEAGRKPATVDPRDDLERRLRADLDPSMQLSVRRVEQIPRTLSGKHRFVIGLK